VGTIAIGGSCEHVAVMGTLGGDVGGTWGSCNAMEGWAT
jgi:hypothetical protein